MLPAQEPPEPLSPFAAKWVRPRGLVAGLVLAILAALVVAAQLATIERLTATAFLFSHYLICAVLILLGIIAFWQPTARRACAAIAAVLALAFAWPWLGDLWANGQRTPTQPTLKVVAFNWKGDSPHHAEVYAWLRRERPDILSIEEFEPTEPQALQSMAALFPYRYTSEADGDVALWSRYPIKTEWGQQIYDRSYDVAIVAAPGGDVTVYAIHPETLRNDLQLTLRNSYFQVLAPSINPRPNILMIGDFNATRWDPYFGKVRAAGRLHEQPWLFPPLTRLSGNNPLIGVTVDHVLAGPRGHLSGCHTGPALGSDHVPLICTVAFKPE